MKFVVSASVIAVMTATGGAYAADLIVDTPMMVEPSVTTSGIKGTVELGVLATYVDQNDDPFDDWAYGGYIGAMVWGGSVNIYWGLDGYLERNSFEDSEVEAPYYVGTLGGHVGYTTGSDLMLGGFVSGGMVPNYFNENSGGYTVGVEGMATFDTVSVFGQLGYADVPSYDDNQFTGAFVRGGLVFSLSDDLAVMADASYGYSEEFEDVGSGDDNAGEFWSVGVKGAFKLPTDFAAFVTAGYEYQHYEALSEPDEGTGDSHTVKVGLSIPFGDSTTAADALNPLATSTLPYRAASWAGTLD